MAQAVTYIAVQHSTARLASDLSKLAEDYSDSRRQCAKLEAFFARAALGLEPCKVTVLQDDYGSFGTQTIAVDVSQLAAGDWLYVGPVGLRCVTGAVTALQDTFTKDTGDTEGATSLKNAINNNSFLAQYVVATSAVAVVTVTSRLPGPICHMFSLRKELADKTGLLFGSDTTGEVVQSCLASTGGTKATATVTCVLANTDDGDTVTIAGKILTGDTTTPADADEFEVATSATNMGNTLRIAINAAEEIRGHVVATNSAGVVTITARVPGTGINAMTVASSDADGLVVSGATMTDGTTAALEAPRSLERGYAG